MVVTPFKMKLMERSLSGMLSTLKSFCQEGRENVKPMVYMLVNVMLMNAQKCFRHKNLAVFCIIIVDKGSIIRIYCA